MFGDVEKRGLDSIDAPGDRLRARLEGRRLRVT
jgi:hypothetical protein